MEEILNLPDIVEQIMHAVVQINTPTGQGTGFFIRDDGLVITNKHVVGNEVYVKVITDNEKEYDGQVFQGNASKDYAFLFTNAPVKRILQFANSESVRVAETVVAIGHPYGYSFTVSEGIISAIERHEVIPGLNSVGFLQLDAGINPGNSGGPLIRRNGDVIGMITLTLMDAKGVSFAIPSNIIINALQEMSSVSKEDALSLLYCNTCGNLNEKDAKYCKKCGASVKHHDRPAGFGDVLKPPVIADGQENIEGPTVSCTSCSSINKASEKYCKKCGSVLVAKSSVGKSDSIKKTSSEEKACSVCGKTGFAGAYCSKCGTLIK